MILVFYFDLIFASSRLIVPYITFITKKVLISAWLGVCSGFSLADFRTDRPTRSFNPLYDQIHEQWKRSDTDHGAQNPVSYQKRVICKSNFCFKILR